MTTKPQEHRKPMLAENARGGGLAPTKGAHKQHQYAQQRRSARRGARTKLSGQRSAGPDGACDPCRRQEEAGQENPLRPGRRPATTPPIPFTERSDQELDEALALTFPASDPPAADTANRACRPQNNQWWTGPSRSALSVAFLRIEPPARCCILRPSFLHPKRDPNTQPQRAYGGFHGTEARRHRS